MSPALPWTPHMSLSLAVPGGEWGCHSTDEEMEIQQGQALIQGHTLDSKRWSRDSNSSLFASTCVWQVLFEKKYLVFFGPEK